MRYQYYIGLSLPTAVSERIAAIQAKLYNPAVVIQPLEPHITLLPPPAVEKIPPDALAQQAQSHAATYLPVTFTLTEIGTFGRRAIVIHVESQTLPKLQTALARLVSDDEQAARVVDRPFRPHVTLNQAARGSRLPTNLVQAYREEFASMLPQVCTVANLTLFRWLKPRTYKAEQL